MTVDPTTWPRQLRLPGQAAAPEGPLDMQMMYLMHHAFRRDLDAFADAVKGTPVRDRRTWHTSRDGPSNVATVGGGTVRRQNV